MIKIKKSARDEMIRQARGTTEEICGVAAGTDSGERLVTKVYFLENIEHSSSRFEADIKERFAAIRDMRGRGLSPIGIFHSHPNTDAYPSSDDIRLAYDENAVYIIISPKHEPSVRAYSIKNGVVTEEEVVTEI